MIRFFDNNFHITEIILAMHVTPSCGVAVHTDRPSHGLVFNTGEDKAYHFSNGVTVLLKHNELLYLPRHSNYRVESLSPVVGCHAINFLINGDEMFEPFSMKVSKPLALQSLFESASDAWQRRGEASKLKVYSLLYEIIYHIKNQLHAEYISHAGLSKIDPAINYISANYSNSEITVHDLAARCGISEVYLRLLFAKRFGVSPIKYITKVRITRARELLAAGGYTVSEVATSVGFSDHAYFSREFKRLTGLSPTEYAKNTVALGI